MNIKLLNHFILIPILFIASCSSLQDDASENVVGCGNVAPSNDSTSNGHEDGKALFQANCAACHHPFKDATGPALQGAIERAPNKEWVYSFVRNSAKLIQEGDVYANELYLKWNKTAMTNFPSLTDEEIDAIMKYCDGCKMP